MHLKVPIRYKLILNAPNNNNRNLHTAWNSCNTHLKNLFPKRREIVFINENSVQKILEFAAMRGRQCRGSWRCEGGFSPSQVGSIVGLVTNLTHVESSARDWSVSLSAIVCPRSTAVSSSVRAIGGQRGREKLNS